MNEDGRWCSKVLNREGLYEELQSAVKKAAMQKKVSEIAGQLSEEYNIPEDLSSEYLIGKSQIRNAENDFFLFALSMKFIPDKLNKYFSETEIKQKSKQKFIVPKLKFPIELDMIKISDDQWIGKISAQELIKFRDAQVIKYNENTQRPLQLYISGEVEHFKITVNKKAVDDISDSFESNLYIPNTITLNVPMNTVIDDTISGKLITIYRRTRYKSTQKSRENPCKMVGFSLLFNFTSSTYHFACKGLR